MITVDIRESNRCNGKASLYLSFPYDDKVIGVIRSMPSRYWNNDNKEWEVPYKALPTILAELGDYQFDINLSNPDLIVEPKEIDVTDIISGFNFKTKPYQHQIDGFKYGLQYDKWLLGDEQGLGKTKEVIDIAVAKKLSKGYKHCLIICGVNGLKWNWVNEVHTHSDEEAHILGQRTRANKTVIGSNADKLYDIEHIDDIDAYFIITNVESLRSEEIVKGLSKLCENGTINMVAADECHKMKNPTSQQGKGFLKIQTETMIAMTGTPLMNNPMDLYIILKWLGYEKHAFYSFKKHYCVMGGFGGYEIIGYQNLSELQSQLNDIMLRRKKDEVLDLPEKTYVDEYVEMTAKQKIIYNEVTAEIKMNIDQIKTAPNPLAELIRMRQATGYTGILSSTIAESAKLDRMEELVDDAIDNGKQVVIFSNWSQITNAVMDRLSKYNPLQITGDTKDELRQINVQDFQSGTRKVIVGTIGAMGTGLTLTAGTVEIFMDEPWNRANKEQAEDRCHRIGQNSNITIYTLMCKDTIDERIHNLVIKKGRMSDAIVDGQVVGNKSELIDYLLD